MIKYLKKRIVGDSLSRLDNKLNTSFSNVDEDISLIRNWLDYLHNKSEDMKKSHGDHISITKKDAQNLNQWVQYLYGHMNKLHKYIGQLTETVGKIEEKHDILNEKLEKIGKGQVRTLQGTSQGQVKDKSNMMLIEKKNEIVLQKSGLDKEELSGSELELIALLYESDRPLSYEDIARTVGKKGKSIRNLIYEIRRKGIEIEKKPIGIRKKGFYLNRNEKIKVSGR